MRYVIDGLLQTKIIEYKLSERERKLLEFISVIGAGKNTVREQFAGISYFWLNYAKFIAEYEYLEIPNTKQVGKHVKDLVDKGLINLHTERSPKGVFTFVTFAKEYYSLLSSNPDNYDQSTPILASDNCASEQDDYASERSPLPVEAQSFGGQKRSHKIQPTKNIPTKIQIEQKNTKKENTVKDELVFNFEEFSENEVRSIHEWFAYKKELKSFYKTQAGLNKFRTTLLNFKRDQQSIVALIDYAISHEWQGVYPAKGAASTQFAAKEEANIPIFTVAAELDPFLS